MPYFLDDKFEVAVPDSAAGNPNFIMPLSGDKGRQSSVYGSSRPYSAVDIGSFNKNDDLAGPYEPVAGFGTFVKAKTQHEDFHYKLWIIPSILNLSNPRLNTDIPFRVWNTWFDPETIEEVRVDGSEVLSFDLEPGDTIRDSLFLTANMRIGSGEASLNADVEFVTENMIGYLQVIAVISQIFNLIPDVPIRETWNYQTDIIRAYRGNEQRISLRRYPRIDLDFTVEILDLRQRREQYDLVKKNIQVQSLVPYYQYATNVTGVTEIGQNVVYLDPKRSNFRVGEFLVAINTRTEQNVIGKIASIGTDSVTLESASGEEIRPGVWVAMPSSNFIIENGSGIVMQNITGTLSIKASSFTEPALVRPGATRTVGTVGDIIHLDRRPNIPAPENFRYDREVLDNEVGARVIKSPQEHPFVEGTRQFTIQRIFDPEEMDYWRDFFDKTRGAQKSFLISTFFPDLTLSPGEVPLQEGASVINVNEGDYSTLYHPYGTWEHIELEFANGVRTQHRVTEAVPNEEGGSQLSFTPALPFDPAFTRPLRISFLTRVRAKDQIVWKHFANYSEVSFAIVTTDT